MHQGSIETYCLTTDKVSKLIFLLHHNRKREQFLIIELNEKVGKIQSYILSGILSIYAM
jgi:hypothetical protein